MAKNNLTAPWALPQPSVYVLHNANVVDPISGSVHPNRNVVLSAGTIKSVEDATVNTVPQITGAITVNCSGKYLSPGLIDCHVHLIAGPGEKDLGSTFHVDENVAHMRQAFGAKAMLRRGFTSARDCAGGSLALKEAIADGVFPGPRMFVAGKSISQTGGHGDLRSSHDHTPDCCGGINNIGIIVDGVAQCLAATRNNLRTGSDFIKIMAGGGVSSPTDALTNVQFTAEEIRAITMCAKNNGTYVTAHAYTSASIQHAINNGVMGIEHGNLMDEETAKLMVEKGAWLTPTLVAYFSMASEEFSDFLPASLAPKNEVVLKAGLESIKMAEKIGVKMCYGTDLLGALTVNQNLEFGVRGRVLSAKSVLQHATINAAEMLGQKNFLGQVKEGFAADLLILNKNPLDDISVLDTPDKTMLAVIKEGRVYASRWSVLAEDYEQRLEIIE